jgi:hypothetical protein
MKKVVETVFSAVAVLGLLFLLSNCGSNSQPTTDASASSVGPGGSVAPGQGGAAQLPQVGKISDGRGGSTAVTGSAGGRTTGSAAGKGGTAGKGSSTPDAGASSKDSGTKTSSDAAPPKSNTPATGTFPPVTDLAGNGPFQTKTVACGTGNAYTCYYPTELAKNGVKNPYLTWGNGATTTPVMYTLLPHLASHGFVVIAANSSSVTSADLTGGLDWLDAENARSGSDFYQKLDTSKVASMGYSLGSVGTFGIGADPRLKTTVHISGGNFDRVGVTNLKNPAAFFCGNDSDIAHANCDLDFEDATVPVFYGNFPGDHLGILAAFTSQISQAVTGWLRWQLMADETLKAMFVGADCGLCKDSNWTVQQKNLK